LLRTRWLFCVRDFIRPAFSSSFLDAQQTGEVEAKRLSDRRDQEIRKLCAIVKPCRLFVDTHVAWMQLRIVSRGMSRANLVEDIMANLTSTMFPPSDSGLLAWSLNFSTLITATPAYASVHAAFGTALAACDPNSRNKSAVAAKNTARNTLKTQARALASTINGTLTVTVAQKIALGIPPRATPSPVPAPSSAPALDVLSVSGWTVTVRLHDSTSGSKRGKPPGVIGASVFSYTGATPPTDISAWKFEGNAGKVTKIEVAFANTLAAGAQVWLTAFWFNGRKQSGPACSPVSTNLQGGSVSMAA
jgi:hypothetical protein